MTEPVAEPEAEAEEELPEEVIDKKPLLKKLGKKAKMKALKKQRANARHRGLSEENMTYQIMKLRIPVKEAIAFGKKS